MFYDCTSLTVAPELPATTLAQNCYIGMFRGCTSLTTAPELPATTLADWCYASMFHSCSNLSKAPELPATTLALACYSNMFKNCRSLLIAPELPATILVDGLEESGGSGCYESMFQGSTNLMVAPKLFATTSKKRCYWDMFNSCKKIDSITCLLTDNSAYECTKNWLNGVAASGTFTKAASMEGWSEGASGIPTGWEVKDAT